MRRWAIFNAVGALGFLVQLGVLTLLVEAGLHYVAATTIAVEAAILHNVCWHTRWTWRDRPRTDLLTTLWRFHLANGLISLVGNAVAMWVLVGTAGVAPLAANVAAVGTCAVVNFVISDRFVFSGSQLFSSAPALLCKKMPSNRRSRDQEKRFYSS